LTALCQCNYFPSFAGPNAAAATWASSLGASSLPVIPFATTCVGDRIAKQTMARARVDFVTAATETMSFMITSGVVMVPPNAPGNCPEAIVWAIVCRQPGQYRSLCVSVAEDPRIQTKSLQFCGYCEQLAMLLRDRNINITDMWEQAKLRDQRVPAVRRPPYPYCLWFSRDEILHRYYLHR
jgi:hypothetical protein